MYKALILIALWMGVVLVSQAQSIRIGTFNVSMEASNYLPKNHQPTGGHLSRITWRFRNTALTLLITPIIIRRR